MSVLHKCPTSEKSMKKIVFWKGFSTEEKKCNINSQKPLENVQTIRVFTPWPRPTQQRQKRQSNLIFRIIFCPSWIRLTQERDLDGFWHFQWFRWSGFASVHFCPIKMRIIAVDRQYSEKCFIFFTEWICTLLQGQLRSVLPENGEWYQWVGLTEGHMMLGF